jgi:glyoxylase-like metal-dependent hydrolase (beta-lactamase superfamily II)
VELKKIYGNTYAISAKAGMLGLYMTGEKEGVFIDTGLAKRDREGLVALLEETQLRPAGIILTHSHYDHTGNAAYLKERFGCPILTSLEEAGLGANIAAFRCGYASMSPGEMQMLLNQECFVADQIVMPGQREVEFCGATFGIIPLPGHTPGQIGVITPDNVAHLADVIISGRTLEKSKLPTALCRALDLQSKESLRALKCRAYILTHEGVYEDISELIDQNIAMVHDRANLVLDCLSGTMDESEWAKAVYQRLEMRTEDTFKTTVYERNVRSFMDYLVDAGRVDIRRVEGIRVYSRKD